MAKKILGVVPARLESTRLNRKPLADICGIPMVVHVAKRAELCNLLDDVVVATDSKEVLEVVKKFGLHAVMTSPRHRNPSERMVELLPQYKHEYFVLVNGDEPLVRPQDIESSIKLAIATNCDASLLSVPTKKADSPSDFKIIKDNNNRLLYISRADIPFAKTGRVEKYEKAYHIMTFRRETLDWYASLDRSYYESFEDHEHLRLIEAGADIRVEHVDHECFSVDTEEDLLWVRERMLTDSIYDEYK